MIWATRTFSEDGWYYVQDQFEEQYDAAGQPQDMMLLYVDTPDFKTRIYVGLPDPSLLTTYDGFKMIEADDLPRYARLLFGDQGAFEQRFRVRR